LDVAAFVLISKLGTCFSAVTFEPIPKTPVSLPSGISFLILLCVVGVLAVMGGIGAKSPRTGRKAARAQLSEEKSAAERSFDPDQLDSLRLRPYEKALLHMRDNGITASDSAALSSLETEFRLAPHTLLIFYNWKKKQASALPPEPTDAERKAAKRAKKGKEDQAAAEEQQERLDQEKQFAADAIAGEYNSNRDRMMFAAVQEALSDFRSSLCDGDGKPLEDLNHDARLGAAVDRVLAQTDKYGNKLYHTIQPRTLIKHARAALLDVNYRPKTKGGAPSVLNSPWSHEFILFLKEQYASMNRTAQNSRNMTDMNQFIIDRYKLMFFKNQEATAPEMSAHTLRKLRKVMKVKAGAANYVSARRWEAMGDPRNYMSWYVAVTVAMKDVPLELRFNWDDTSLFVAGEQRGGVVGVAFTAEEVERELAALNRSPGMQQPAAEPGKHCSPRMVQWGVLASGGGRLEACVIKVYDRAIAVKDNLRLQFIRKSGDCDIHVLYIRGKQLASNTDPTGAEAIAHGGLEEHADETAVAKKIFEEVVAEKIERRKAEYFVIMKRIAQQGFGGKLGSPEMQQLVTEELMAMRQRARESVGSFPEYPDIKIPRDENYFEGWPTDEDETPATPRDRDPPTPGVGHTPGSFYGEREAIGDEFIYFSESELSESEPESDSSSDDDDDEAPVSLPGMGTCSSCAHLPEWLDVQHHTHTIYKTAVTADTAEYQCAVCNGRGVGGMVYQCLTCPSWRAHLSCVLPASTKEDPLDTSMLLHPTAVTQMYDLPVQAFAERAVLIMDGCNGQVRAAVGTPENPGVLLTIFLPKGIDIIKGSAQCSPSQNPLDCMRSFMNVKRLVSLVFLNLCRC
jgi:hypothetical protein